MFKIYLDKTHFRLWKKISNINIFSLWMNWFLKLVFNNNYEFVNTLQKCNVCIQECTNLNPVDGKLNIILCAESDRVYSYFNPVFLKSNIKFIGAVEDSENSFNVPILNKNGKNFDPYTLELNKNNLTIDQRFKLNSKDIVFIRKHIEYNRELISKILVTTNRNGISKNEILQKFIFNFCPENSLSLYNGLGGYITEKLYECVYNGCIPIYYGGNIEKYSILNPSRVLQVYTYKQARELRLKIQDMSLNDIIKIAELPILRPDIKQFVKYRKYKLKEFILN